MDQGIDAPITRSSQRVLAITNGLSLRSGRALERDDDDPKMRIGADFQALLPELKGSGPGQTDTREGRPEPLLLWKPTDVIPDEDIDGFLTIARNQYTFSPEQSLGILFWFNYNVKLSLDELKHYSPFEDDWTVEDKVIFEQAFQKYGKNFQRIRAMIPAKPIGSLVKFYYQWKKEHCQMSLIDKKACMKKLWSSPMGRSEDHAGGKGTTKGKKLPKDIHLTRDGFLKTADDKYQHAIKRLDKEIEQLQWTIQRNKQLASLSPVNYLEKEDIELLRPASAPRRSSHLELWTSQEIETALNALRTFGNDIVAVSGAVETKSVQQCEAFMIHFKRKYCLPTLLHDYQLKQRSSRMSEGILAEEDQLTDGRPVEQEYLPVLGGSDDGAPAAKRTKLITTA